MKANALLLTTLIIAGGGLGMAAIGMATADEPGTLLDGSGMMDGGLLPPMLGGNMESATLANPDSIRQARMYEAVDEAAKIYKHLKWQKYQGEDDNAVYSSAMQCYQATVKAVELTDNGSAEYEQCKNMLKDINRDLLQGAFHFSSVGDNVNMTSYSQAVVDTRLMPMFEGTDFGTDNGAYPAIVYCAASGAYNAKEYARAIKYFDIYLATGESRSRENIYQFLGQACLNTGEYGHAITSMNDAMREFPANYSLVLIKLQAAMDGGHAELLQETLNKAFVFRPGDEQLLMIQGKLYEDQQEYTKAIDTYTRLDELRPNNLGIAKRLALCYYNLGVSYYNKIIFEEDEKNKKKYRRQSDAYFDTASMKLEEVVANDPTAMKYLKALAVSYGCLGKTERFADVNTRIRALGDTPVSEKDIPSELTVNEGNATNFASAGNTNRLSNDAPAYSDFAKAYIEKNMIKWVHKDEFEKIEDYDRRVNDASIRGQVTALAREAESEYLTLYTRQLRPKDFRLMPYDAGNEVYLIESSYGPIYLPVPLANGEAEIFKANWDRMKVHNPSYYINENKVLVAGITFMTPYGKSYTFDNSKAREYAQTPIDIDFDRILAEANTGVKVDSPHVGVPKGPHIVTVKSDVDENIPITGKKANSTFAVIIANEEYANVPNVEAAINDGTTFSRYLNLTMGLPKENIRVYHNAGLAQMHLAFADIRNIVSAYGGQANVIFYYAGHGMPDESTKNAFLLPVDGNALVAETCLSLNKVYADLGSMGAKSVMVFLDACFSGSQRSENGMLTSARSVVIKAKDAAPQGNMFSFTATSGQETALPYREKNHGLFTYFLLKKLQESKGNVSLKDLTDYVTDNVKRQSTVTNGKPQTPTVIASGEMAADWTKRKFLHE